MLSALKTHNVDEIHDSFTKNRVVINSIIFGSCFSASYANDFSCLLHPRCGVMLSSTVSQGGTNFFENVVSVVLKEKNSNEFFETTQEDNQVQNPTGICISKRDKHFGLELSEYETGLPMNSVNDEYELSLNIVLHLRKEKPGSNFGISLDECNDKQQKEEFNGLLNRAFGFQEPNNNENLHLSSNSKQESSSSEKTKPWSPLVKFSLFAGGVLLIGGGCYLLSQYKGSTPVK